jgi:hypothetical protein
MKKKLLIAPAFLLGFGTITMTVTPAFANQATCTESMNECYNTLNSGTSTRTECETACETCTHECAGFNGGTGCRRARQLCAQRPAGSTGAH